jgi:hypothetical protein
VLKDFFEWATLTGRLHGDPARPIHPPKKRGVHRETFSDDERAQIIAAGPDSEQLFRDRCALRLLLTYAIRKDSLRRVQFSHFDHNRRRLTIFTKGAKVRTLPIVEAGFWDDLGRHLIEWGADPDDSCSAAAPSARTGTRPGRSSSPSIGPSRWASTGCTSGDTAASSGPGSSPRGRRADGKCT